MFPIPPRGPALSLLTRDLQCSWSFVILSSFLFPFLCAFLAHFSRCVTVSSVHLCSRHQCSETLAFSNSFWIHTQDSRTFQKAFDSFYGESCLTPALWDRTQSLGCAWCGNYTIDTNPTQLENKSMDLTLRIETSLLSFPRSEVCPGPHLCSPLNCVFFMFLPYMFSL